jgi:hypothetical protein
LFKRIQKKLPQLVLCKDMLVVPPTEHIVRGFLLEATSQKGRVYLWKVVTPLLRPMSSVVLNYSSRISGSEPELYIRDSAFEEAAEKVGEIVNEHIEYLKEIRCPRDFLRHADWVVGRSPALARLDQALVRYIAGDVQQSVMALRALDEEVAQWDEQRRRYLGPLLKQIMREMNTDPERLQGLLVDWENANVEKLGLQPSRVFN